MLRQQLAALLLLAACALPASAQQVFINNMYVMKPDFNTASAATNCEQINTRFSCPCTFNNTTCEVNLDDFGIPLSPNLGNISNQPHIEFEAEPDASCPASVFPVGVNSNNVCNNRVMLCCTVGWSNTQTGNVQFALDFVSFEVFKFQQGSNPLDPQSTPPIRTYFIDDPGIIGAGTDSTNCYTASRNPAICNALPPACVLWDGSFNIQGEFGKSNGQYGFRCTVATNVTSQTAGNINIQQTRAYPSAATRDADPGCSGGCPVEQKPITMDVVNAHVVRSSPTVVGDITGVAAEPYNITYRLSKDATTYLTIHNASSAGLPLVRTVVPGLPRVGEGIPSGTLQNGDSWNGRFDNGDLAPPGVYLATIQALVRDQYGIDISSPVTRQISLDTLQITDIRVQPLLDQSTSLAVLTYLLTEPATVFIDIYPPGTQFINGLNDVNNVGLIPDINPDANGGRPKDFGPRFNGASVAPLLRHIEEVKDFRRPVISFWDGRDFRGSVLPDGDYVFVIYAALPSQNGHPFLGNASDKRIWSTNAKSGFITISRGMVTISQVGPTSTVIGSSPPVAGLDPFTFSYSLSRDANVSLKIFDATGLRLVRTIINNELRPGNFLNRERWSNPVDDEGRVISSGTYLIQLTAADPFFPSKVSTTTANFPVNLFRITDVFSTPLLTGATDVITLSYQLSQAMNVAWNIYPPGTVVTGSTGTWPPCAAIEPGTCGQTTLGGVPIAPMITIRGMRPGRLRVTEFWDGRDISGLFVPDGTYIFTLTAQSTTTPRYFATDQVWGTLTIARGSIVFPIFSITPTVPQLFNSSQTITLPPYEVAYSLTRQSSVTIQVMNTSIPPSVIRTLVSGQVRDSNIVNREFWDARDDSGNFVQPGFYTIRAIAEDLASLLASGSTAQQTISVDPLRIYDVAISPLRADVGNALIAYQVSETMKVSLKIYKPGTSFDPSGNPNPPESTSLVKRIVGVRPARQEITEIWDGTDEKLSKVTDGNYIFKIVGSTDINSIDTITGNVRPGASLAQDLIIAEIPVVRGGSIDPLAEFQGNTFVYPNPIRGSSANFQIYVPFQASVSLKIYNLAGELVLDKGFGTQAADSYVNFVWNKTNQAGRPVARGVYFMLVREDTNRGEKTPFQMVKKFLIP